MSEFYRNGSQIYVTFRHIDLCIIIVCFINGYLFIVVLVLVYTESGFSMLWPTNYPSRLLVDNKTKWILCIDLWHFFNIGVKYIISSFSSVYIVGNKIYFDDCD